jgi:hypothetical protein
VGGGDTCNLLGASATRGGAEEAAAGSLVSQEKTNTTGEPVSTTDRMKLVGEIRKWS